ncbi:zinc transport system permease protein [Nocardioides lianchengensis]|uniref:Zinc transport system permease protein n=1 Tax=Nocardioides lianchengensis TaxID=1045774 RepID=A0A1G6WRZ3_9ACTN|nr:metal ABC transporter permease [Nocardioides lianchengensis]NYG09234.1 zinc transport system permease protein [Nocardioides lianchengensis]SDD67977.1 zinc transport system permease protein [Nocardioides lianchengensis]
MIELLQYQFMQRALLAAFVTGLAAPVIGTYLVQRRLALLGDGLGHVAVTGVALGLLTGVAPTWTAVVVAVLGAIAIEVIRERGHTSGDLALALLFYGGLAGGVMITGLAGQTGAKLQQYLFGSITSISRADLWFTLGLAAVILLLGLGLLPQLFTVSQDEDFARVAGLNVRAYNLLVAVLAAVTVTVAMRTVGLLLVSALMIVPVAASQQLARSFRATVAGAVVVGAGAGVGGLLVSAYLSTSHDLTVAPGPAIVLLALACFVATWPVGALLRRRARLRRPFPAVEAEEHAATHQVCDEQHAHEHGPDCGHPAVPHGDHVDYVHDGHRHAVHGRHYDEH